MKMYKPRRRKKDWKPNFYIVNEYTEDGSYRLPATCKTKTQARKIVLEAQLIRPFSVFEIRVR